MGSRTCTVRFARGNFYQGEGRACRQVGVAHSFLIRMWFDNDLASELVSSRTRHEAHDTRFVLPAPSSPMESLVFENSSSANHSHFRTRSCAGTVTSSRRR